MPHYSKTVIYGEKNTVHCTGAFGSMYLFESRVWPCDSTGSTVVGVLWADWQSHATDSSTVWPRSRCYCKEGLVPFVSHLSLSKPDQTSITYRWGNSAPRFACVMLCEWVICCFLPCPLSNSPPVIVCEPAAMSTAVVMDPPRDDSNLQSSCVTGDSIASLDEVTMDSTAKYVPGLKPLSLVWWRDSCLDCWSKGSRHTGITMTCNLSRS